MSFLQRKIRLIITLGSTPQNPNQVFDGTNSNTVTLEGLRISANILKAGGKGLSTANLRIYGMTFSVMNKLSTLGVPIAFYVAANTITIQAGDDVSGMSTVFEGNIQQAWGDFEGMPDVAFNIQAFVGALNLAAPTAPTSYPGSFDVATAMSGLAVRGGYNFQNNGVSVQLPASYFSGSLINQINQLVEHANIAHIIENGTLYIWPMGGSRDELIPEIGPDSGLALYPKYTGVGISFRTVYNPSIGFGSKIKMKTSLTPAAGIWIVKNLVYDLESEMPDGKWFTDVEAAAPGFVVVTQ